MNQLLCDLVAWPEPFLISKSGILKKKKWCRSATVCRTARTLFCKVVCRSATPCGCSETSAATALCQTATPCCSPITIIAPRFVPFGNTMHIFGNHEFSLFSAKRQQHAVSVILWVSLDSMYLATMCNCSCIKRVYDGDSAGKILSHFIKRTSATIVALAHTLLSEHDTTFYI